MRRTSLGNASVHVYPYDVTDEVIKSLCLEALRPSEGNKRRAARILGIARDSLYRHIKRLGIEEDNATEN
jgi:DNA-binding NtrC family response regulator